MRNYHRIGFILLLVCFWQISIQAQSTIGDASILYIGVSTNADDTSRPIYIRDIEQDGAQIMIGYVDRFGSDTSWSPNGNFVHIVNYDGDDNRILTLYDVATHTNQVITTDLLYSDCQLPVYWSRNDRFLAYVYTEDNNNYIALWDAHEDTTQLLGQVPTFYHWLWSANSRYLVLPTEERNIIRLWDTVTNQDIATLSVELPFGFRWSSDDRYFMYMDGSLNQSATLNIFDTQTGEIMSSMGNTLGTFAANNQYAVYSSRDSQTLNYTVILRDFNTESETILTDSASSPWLLRWSADGDYFAYVTENRQLNAATLFLLDMATGTTQELLTSTLIRDIIWSSSSNTLAILYVPNGQQEDPANLDLYQVEIDSLTEVDARVPNSYVSLLIRWSPSGNYLNFISAEHTGLNLEISTNTLLDTSDWVEQITLQVPFNWSADDRYMLFSGREHNTDSIFVYDATQDTVSFVDDANGYGTFMGWRGTNRNNSLIYCGEG